MSQMTWACDLGKTIQSLSAALEMGAKKILIICPSSIIPQWAAKSKEFFPGYFIEAFINKPLQCRHFPKWVVISGYSRAGTNRGRDQLRELQYDFVIVDEMHFLKNPQANRTKNILGSQSFLSKAKQVCLMSGTPVLNRPSEVYIVLKAFAPKALGKYLPWPIFVRRFCGFQARGATHVEELAAILDTFILRRTKEQVLKELPPIVETVINVPNISDPWDQPLPTRRKSVSLEKIDYIIQYVKDLLETIDKVLLIVYHRETIQILKDTFKNSVVLQGGMSGEEKNQNIQEFRTNSTCNLLIGQINVAGYGIDGLQDVCNYIVFGELDWSPGILDQAKDRLRRIGQSKTVFCHYLIATGTIEEEIDLRLEWKRDVISQLIRAADVSGYPVQNPTTMNIIGEQTEMVQHLEALLNDLADRVAQKVLAGMPATKPVSKPKATPTPEATNTFTASAAPATVTVESTPTIAPQPEVIQALPVSRDDLTTQAQGLLKSLRDAGAPKEDVDSYYRNVVLDGFKVKKIAEMAYEDLLTLKNRLESHDLDSALAFLVPPTQVADEV